MIQKELLSVVVTVLLNLQQFTLNKLRVLEGYVSEI